MGSGYALVHQSNLFNSFVLDRDAEYYSRKRKKNLAKASFASVNLNKFRDGYLSAMPNQGIPPTPLVLISYACLD